MADWSTLLTREGILKSNIRVVQSRLIPKVTNKAGATETYTISGEELNRRINGVEGIKSCSVLGQLLSLGKRPDCNGRNHSPADLKRLVELLIEKEDKKKTAKYSCFTLLAEDDVSAQAKSLQEVAAWAIDEEGIREKMAGSKVGASKAGRSLAFENTRTVMKEVIGHLKDTNFNEATHGGVKIFEAVYSMIDTLLP